VKMSTLNRRIIEAIDRADFSENIRFFLKNILTIELGNLGDKRPRYGEDYDRAIKKFVKRSLERRSEDDQ